MQKIKFYKTILALKGKDRDFFLLHIFFFLMFVSSVILFGDVHTPDTSTYISFHPIRPPLYPIFLKINQLIFQGAYFKAVIGWQLILGFLGICYFCNVLLQTFTPGKQSLLLQFMVMFTLSILYLPFSSFPLGNMILTEALCYPVFLFALGTFIEGLRDSNMGRVYTSFLCCAVLVITRTQFLFVVPIYIMAIIAFYLLETDIKALVKILAIFLLMIFGSMAFEKAYHRILHSETCVLSLGRQLSVPAFFVAKAADKNLFPEESTERKFFEIAYAELDEKGIVNTENYTLYKVHIYDYNYGNIATILQKNLQGMEVDVNLLDAFMAKVSLTLIKNNLSAYICFCIKGIVKNIGGIFFLGVQLGMTLLFALLLRNKTNNTKLIAISGLFLLGMQFANYTLVVLVEPVLLRYVFYTDSVVVALLFVLLSNIFVATKDKGEHICAK